jgi:ankyrin repeat protein
MTRSVHVLARPSVLLLLLLLVLAAALTPAVAAAQPSQRQLGEQLRSVITGYTPSLAADSVRRLLQRGADVNGRFSNGRTPLLEAASRGIPSVIEVLLAAGAEVNVHRADGATPLMLAAGSRMGAAAAQLSGTPDHVAPLLRRGAAVEARDTTGSTALFYGVAGSSPVVVTALLEGGATVEARDKIGMTPLMYAMLLPRTEIAQLLLRRRASANARSTDGVTPLMMAAAAGNTEGVRLLLLHGADVRARRADGLTALSLAEAQGHSAVFTLLRAAGGSSRDGDIPSALDLNLAAHSGWFEGTDPEWSCTSAYTPQGYRMRGRNLCTTPVLEYGSGDVAVEVVARMIEVVGEPRLASAGFEFGWEDASLRYSVHIRGDGRVVFLRITRSTAGSTVSTLFDRAVPAVRPGTAENRLRVELRGASATLQVNGTSVGVVELAGRPASNVRLVNRQSGVVYSRLRVEPLRPGGS